MRYSSLMTGVLMTAVVAACLLSGCQDNTQQTRKEIGRISFCADNFQLQDDEFTKTVIGDGGSFMWTEQDTVGIYPNTGSQVFFEITDGADASTAVFDGGGWALKPSSVYYGYYPFIGDIYLDKNNIEVSFTGQKQTGIAGVNHIGGYDYMYAPGTTSDNGALNFQFHHLCCIIRPKVTLPAGTYTKLAVTAPSAVFAVRGHYDLQALSPAIVADENTDQLVIDLDQVTLNSDGTFMVYLVSAPVDLQGVEITVSVLDSERKEYQCKKTPSRAYTAGTIGGLTCSTFIEVPQAMGLIVENWGNGGTIGGNAD